VSLMKEKTTHTCTIKTSSIMVMLMGSRRSWQEAELDFSLMLPLFESTNKAATISWDVSWNLSLMKMHQLFIKFYMFMSSCDTWEE
jgi:hypothetical protein